MGKELDARIDSCRRYIRLMKDECNEVGVYVKQAKPVMAKCEQLLKEYINLRFGSEKDPKKAEKVWSEFAKLVKQGKKAMESIRDTRTDLEGDVYQLEARLDKLRKHVSMREKKNLFRSKTNTKEARGLIKAYSQFLSMSRTAAKDAFRLWLEFDSMNARFLKGTV